MRLRLKFMFALLAVCCMLLAGTAAVAAEDNQLNGLNLQSTTFVPGQEGRYTISFSVAQSLDLSKGATVNVDFPDGFTLVQNSIDSADPGCTLSSIQYKNNPTDRYSVLQRNVSVQEGNELVFSTSNKSAEVNSNVIVYLVIPGVVNKPSIGTETVSLRISDAGGREYAGNVDVTLGDPPAGKPHGLVVTANGSGTVNASWDAVEGASRYQFYYSTDPFGQFIQACDYGKEPAPGEEWNLSGTSCSYSGKGNGGLEAGKTYYFKVRAGNEFGYGDFSKTVKEKTPEVKMLPSTVGRSDAQVQSGDTVTVWLDQPVKVTDADRIQIYEVKSWTPLVKTLEANGDTVNITAPLLENTVYMVVFYDQALESTVSQGVYNRIFGWTFATRVHPKGNESANVDSAERGE